MFLSFSQTLARFGGFRLGLGVRLNKKNSPLVFLVIMFVAIFKAMWYMMILCFWLMYAMVYGVIYAIKKLAAVTRDNQKTDN